MEYVKAKKNLDDYEKKFFTSLPTCYTMFVAFDSDNIAKSYFPFSTSTKCWHEKNGLQDILKGIKCGNKLCKTDGL